MKNVYLGTSDFAATVLRDLAEGAHRPALVVTPPDRRSGRGRRVSPPPVAVAAAELGIELAQFEDVNAGESRERIAAPGAGVVIVCAFGQLIKEPLLSSAEILNVHPSLLPRWRGAAPIERSLMAGDATTGVCVMRLTAGLDSGPVALREEVSIGPGDDYGALAGSLAAIGGRLLGAALDLADAGDLRFEEQDEAGVTYAEKIESAERRVDPRGSAVAEGRRIRALTPHIGAFVITGGDSRLGLRDPVVLEGGPAAGTFAEADGTLVLGCGSGALRIGAIQPPGKRWMAAGDFLRGYGLPAPAESPEMPETHEAPETPEK